MSIAVVVVDDGTGLNRLPSRLRRWAQSTTSGGPSPGNRLVPIRGNPV